MRRHLPALCTFILLALAYLQVYYGSAQVEVELLCEHEAPFRIYWTRQGVDFSEGRMAVFHTRKGHAFSRFRIGDLGDLDLLRIDPTEHSGSWVELRRLTLRQNGFATVQLAGPKELSRLQPLQGIAEFARTKDGVRIRTDSEDGHLLWQLTPPRRELPWRRMLLDCGIIGLLVLTGTQVVRRAGLNDCRWVPLALVLALALMLAMTVNTPYNVHPDEQVHVQAAEYFQHHWLPPPIGDPAIRHTYSVYGVSRLHSGELFYWLAGRYLQLIDPLHLPPYLALRIFNLLLWSAMLLWIAARSSARLPALALLVSPQIWYVFSYANSDAYALVLTMVMAWQVTAPGTAFARLSEGGLRLSRVMGLGLLLGGVLLCKPNFYFVPLFLAGLVLWRLWRDECWNWRQVWRGWLAVAMVGLLVFGLTRAVEYHVNGPDRSAKLYQARVEHALPIYNPTTPLHERHMHLQMRERGTTLARFLRVDRWGGKIFQSTFGVYGYTTVVAPATYYKAVRWLGLGLLALLIVSVLRSRERDTFVLLGWTASVGGLLVLMALHIAWTIDFQAQGRYFLPLVPMLAVLLARLGTNLPGVPLQLGVLALYALSLYSFLCIGLTGLVSRYGV